MALAAYNRGEYGLGRDMKSSRSTNIKQMRERRAVPRETEKYVPKFMATTIIGDDLQKYGFSKIKYEAPLEYDEVVINDVIDLKIVAGSANTTEKKIRELNPSIRVWCTPLNYPDFNLRIPKGSKELFLQNIAKVKNLNPSRGFIKYKVRKGDCLGTIARKFKTTVKAIKRDNKLYGKKYLKINQRLIIRPGKKYYRKA